MYGNTVRSVRKAESTHTFILKNLQIGTNVGRIRIRIVIARDVFDPKRTDNGLFVGSTDIERLADPSVCYQHERIVFAEDRIVKCKRDGTHVYDCVEQVLKNREILFLRDFKLVPTA